MTNEFNPVDHLRTIKSKDGEQAYLDVKWRLVWLRSEHPDAIIETEELAYDVDREIEAEVFMWNDATRKKEKQIKHGKGYARYKAPITIPNGGRATGTKSENAANFADFGEKAETGAIGQGLRCAGIWDTICL